MESSSLIYLPIGKTKRKGDFIHKAVTQNYFHKLKFVYFGNKQKILFICNHNVCLPQCL